MFLPKGSAELKFIYPRAMHIPYLLTGEERALDIGRIMAILTLKWDPVYNRGFWTPRHEGYGLLGVLHGWEMTGEPFGRRLRTARTLSTNTSGSLGTAARPTDRSGRTRNSTTPVRRNLRAQRRPGWWRYWSIQCFTTGR